MGSGGSLPAVKRPACGDDNLPPSSARLGMSGAIPLLPCMFSWCVWEQLYRIFTVLIAVLWRGRSRKLLSEVFTGVTTSITVYLDLMPCSLVGT